MGVGLVASLHCGFCENLIDRLVSKFPRFFIYINRLLKGIERHKTSKLIMDIKNEFFPCLLERGLLPEYHVDRFITFVYNSNTFSIRPLQHIVKAEVENIISMPLETEIFSLILYNINSYELTNSKQEQMLYIAANLNLKYRGIKVIISIEDDFHAEIHLELLNSFSRELKNNLEKYLNIMLLVNDEISKAFQ